MIERILVGALLFAFFMLVVGSGFNTPEFLSETKDNPDVIWVIISFMPSIANGFGIINFVRFIGWFIIGVLIAFGVVTFVHH
jgi:hypothetical protein